MSNVFSAKEVNAMEPRVQDSVKTLLKCIRTKSAGGKVAETDEYGEGKGWRYDANGGVVLDLRPWLNMFSFDAITSVFWSNPYGNLKLAI